MTCQQVADAHGTSLSTANKWAAANGVGYTGEGKRKTYQWTQADLDRFLRRLPKGRPRKNGG